MYVYIYTYVYIYIYTCVLFPFGYLCTFMHGFDSTVRRYARVHLWSRHMPICEPFTLKRSMYDYKLHVSLLIFVYSLMDSDERASLQKKKVCVQKKNCQTCLMNTLFNVSLTVKKYKPLIFVSCDISLQACGGWAGSSQNCGCRIFNFPSQLRFPPLFFPNFVDGKIRCLGGRSNVWIKSHGGMSTNQKHQWMISNG